MDLRQVWKSYFPGQFAVHALRGVDFAVAEGSFVAVMGPSGSGKSTLMHIMGCLDTPTSGSYLLAGEDVSVMPEPRLARIRNRRIGFVFQGYNLLPRLSAWRNVSLPLVYSGVPSAERRRRALRALDLVGLSDRSEHRPTELSGGQQQRVAIARALVADPSVILADEPTGNLDSTASAEILRFLTELNASGRTLVLITHDQGVAEAAGRIVQIRDGRIEADALRIPA
jgi:putative ABC transport system ATP-binding protein